MDKPSVALEIVEANQSKFALVIFALSILFALGWFCIKGEGYHFYLAKGLTIDEVINRYGEPVEKRHDLIERTSALTNYPEQDEEFSLIYYSDNLIVVEVKFKQNRVFEIGRRMAD